MPITYFFYIETEDCLEILQVSKRCGADKISYGHEAVNHFLLWPFFESQKNKQKVFLVMCLVHHQNKVIH